MIYFIPVRLDECEIPDLEIPDLGLRIRDFHWLDLWQEGGFEQLIRALEKGLGTTGQATSELRKGPLTPTPRPRERMRVTRREPSRDFIKEIGEFLELAKEVKADDLKANMEKLKLPVEGLDAKVDGDKVTVFGRTPSQEIREKVILALGNVPGIAKVEDRMDTLPGAQAAFYTVQKGDQSGASVKFQKSGHVVDGAVDHHP